MAPPQVLPPTDMPQFYPGPPSGPPGQMPVLGYPPQDQGFALPPFQPHPEQSDIYPGAQQQAGPPPLPVGHTSPHMPPQMPHPPIPMNHPPPHMSAHMPPSPGHMPPVEPPPPHVPPEMQITQPIPSSLPPQMDIYDHMAQMVRICESRTCVSIGVLETERLLLCSLVCSSGFWEEIENYFTVFNANGAFGFHTLTAGCVYWYLSMGLV